MAPRSFHIQFELNQRQVGLCQRQVLLNLGGVEQHCQCFLGLDDVKLGREQCGSRLGIVQSRQHVSCPHLVPHLYGNFQNMAGKRRADAALGLFARGRRGDKGLGDSGGRMRRHRLHRFSSRVGGGEIGDFIDRHDMFNTVHLGPDIFLADLADNYFIFLNTFTYPT